MDNNLEGKSNYILQNLRLRSHPRSLTDDPSILDGTYLVRLSAAAQERLEVVAEEDLYDLEPMKSVSLDDIKRELELEEDSGLKHLAAQIKVGRLRSALTKLNSRNLAEIFRKQSFWSHSSFTKLNGNETGRSSAARAPRISSCASMRIQRCASTYGV